MKGTVAVNEAGAYLDCGLKGFGLIQVAPHIWPCRTCNPAN